LMWDEILMNSFFFFADLLSILQLKQKKLIHFHLMDIKEMPR
jgi:hypothetical protein